MPSTNSPNAIREATSSSVSALAVMNYKPAEDALHRWQGKFTSNAVLHKDELKHLHLLQVKAALAAGRAACSVMRAYTSPLCTCAGLVPSMCSCCSVCTYNPESLHSDTLPEFCEFLTALWPGYKSPSMTLMSEPQDTPRHVRILQSDERACECDCEHLCLHFRSRRRRLIAPLKLEMEGEKHAALRDVERATIVSNGCRGFAWEHMLNWFVVTQT